MTVDEIRDGFLRVGDHAQLSLVFERTFPMWWEENCWFRVGVQNTSSRVSADNVEAKLISIKPNPLPLNVLPSRLGRKDGNTDGCRINPGDTDYFDVVQGVPLENASEQLKFMEGKPHAMIDTRSPRSLTLWTVAYTGQVFELNPDITYELVIRVTAANARTEERPFVMRHSRGGMLDFGPAETDS